MSMDLKDAHKISSAINSGQISAREVAMTALKRIESVDHKLGAFLTVEPDRVMGRAEEIDRMVKERAFPLAGVPVAAPAPSS
jgi:Asp-tRNA(Asn)/Glu-tRNA(Gln) amidotransferase A subunit family amidase